MIKQEASYRTTTIRYLNIDYRFTKEKGVYRVKKGVKIYSEEGELCAEFFSVKRKGSSLIIDGKVLGVMRMDMILTFDEFVNALSLLFCWASISFILLIPTFIIKRLANKSKNIFNRER